MGFYSQINSSDRVHLTKETCFHFSSELIMKSIIPVVMAGIIAIYGVVVSVLIAGELDDSSKYSLYK